MKMFGADVTYSILLDMKQFKFYLTDLNVQSTVTDSNVIVSQPSLDTLDTFENTDFTEKDHPCEKSGIDLLSSIGADNEDGEN